MGAWLARIGFIAFTGCMFWLLSQTRATVHSQTSGRISVEDGGLQVVSAMLPTGVQQISMIDVRSRTLAVYQIEPAGGKIQLKSVRNIVLDLQMEHFNGQAPLPSELRKVQP